MSKRSVIVSAVLSLLMSLFPLNAVQPQEVGLIRVPELQGRREGVAEQTLRLLRLLPAKGVYLIAPENWRDELEIGIVQIQSPQPGAFLPEGETVAFWTFVKAGPATKVVVTPDVRKLSRRDADEKLKGQGLQSMTLRTELDVEQALVRDQFPRPGQRVLEGTSIHLRIRP